ncbi:Lrp/AsnC family transcriptional regulator [Paenibacillus arenilitoris]|uniref:Lrp/AsnC family transcriptional regulator n=1 Tax=Paenibacillus arenilitoris TaxID=2772299 RepID=A0A927CJX4_9BACL|nr:Lrp/AsnC family transcriptional regulator [Paenibacillus arenilitoris]MBD2869429.1 Lrp/AsnC family transcriptional regulator [Paenibacillus arenilitoris]
MLDHTDKRILEELAKDGRISMKKLGEKVHLTGQAAANRVVKLEEDEVIEGYTVRLNHKKTGFAVHAFLTIFTKSHDHQPFLSFVASEDLYVVHNYKISGEGCYLLECRFPSNEELDKFLSDLNRHANYKLSVVIGGS